MNQEAINSDLRERADSQLQTKVLKEVRNYMKVSSDHMSKYWANWERDDRIYRGYLVPDKDDKKANAKKEPSKLIVPMTYAQTQTAISFVFSTLIQRENLFEVQGFSPEDKMKALNIEHDLQYQVNKDKTTLKLYCWLLDMFKTGFGVVKCEWREEHADMKVQREVVTRGLANRLFGAGHPKISVQEVVEEVLMYQGNMVSNVSPYSFYPDPSVPLAKFQEGLFVGHEEETSKKNLLRQEGKMYHGVKHIPNSMDKTTFEHRKRYAGRNFGEVKNFRDKSQMNIGSAEDIILSEMCFDVVPADWTKATGIDLGDETRPIKYIATFANDSKLIRFEPQGYLHNKFTYSLAEYSPDHNSFYNPGLASTINELQGLTNWFLNSHVLGVRKILKNRLLVDPAGVEMDDIRNDKAYIRMISSGSKNPDRVLKQLQVNDVTGNHVNDLTQINSIIQLVTGINENALGQFSSGRRSATEARNVNAGAAARLKMHAQLFWLQGLEPLAQQFLANTRQGRDENVYNMIMGELAKTHPYSEVIPADPNKIAGGYDFVPYDASLPTDKDRQARVQQDLFGSLISSPEAAQMLDIHPKPLLDHIMQLNGITNMRDFSFAANQNFTPQPTVVPDNEIPPDGQPVDLGNNLIQQLAQGSAV